MLAVTIKIVVTAILVVAISEVAKRSSLLGAVLASIPAHLRAGDDLALRRHGRRARSRRAWRAASSGWCCRRWRCSSPCRCCCVPAGRSRRAFVAAGALTVACYFLMLAMLKRFGIAHLTSRTVTGRARAAMPSPMLHINDLSFRIEGRPIFEQATAGIPTGHKVGLVGRNGAGKTTLLKIIAGDLAPDMGSITMARSARIGHVAQEAPGGDGKHPRLGARRRHRAREPARSRPSTRATRIASPRSTSASTTSARTRRRRAPRRSSPASASTRQRSSARAARCRAAGACASRSPPCCSSSRRSCCSTSRPTTSTSKAPCGSRATCAPIRTPSSSSATTATCSTAR